MHESNPLQELCLSFVNPKTLKKLISYCEHHRGSVPADICRPLKSPDLLQCGVEPWDAEFIDLNNYQELSDLIVLAKFFGVQDLLQLSCAKMASLIKQNQYQKGLLVLPPQPQQSEFN